jgi:hypothetical protein
MDQAVTASLLRQDMRMRGKPGANMGFAFAQA